MKPHRATSYLMLACHFLAGAVRARFIGGEALTKLSQLRASHARACFRDWLYHSRKAGAFTPSTEAQCQEAEAPAVCPSSQLEVPPTSEGVNISVPAQSEAMLLLQKSLRHAPAEGCPNGSLEGWDDANPASYASVSKGLEPPSEVLRLLELPGEASLSLFGSNAGLTSGEMLPPPTMSSVNSSPDFAEQALNAN